MPHPNRYCQVQIIGDCFNGADIWTTGFSLGSITGDPNPPLLAGAEAIGAAWQAFFTNAASNITNDYRTLAIKYNEFGTDGRQRTDPTIEYIYPVPIVGGSSNPSHPPQTTLVCSLRGQRSRGLASKGRMYLPVTGSGLGADGKLGAGANTQIASLMADFFRAVRSSIDVGNMPLLTSPVGLLGASQFISEVAVGNVYDTQRRRRNSFDESYAAELLEVTG